MAGEKQGPTDWQELIQGKQFGTPIRKFDYADTYLGGFPEISPIHQMDRANPITQLAADYMSGGKLYGYVQNPFPMPNQSPSMADIGLNYGHRIDHAFEKISFFLHKWSGRKLSQLFIDDIDQMEPEVRAWINTNIAEEDRDQYMWMRTKDDLSRQLELREADQLEKVYKSGAGFWENLFYEVTDPLTIASMGVSTGIVGALGKLTAAGVASAAGRNVGAFVARATGGERASVFFNGIKKASELVSSETLLGRTAHRAWAGAKEMAVFSVVSHLGRESISLPVEDLGESVLVDSLVGAAFGAIGGGIFGEAKRARIKKIAVQETSSIIAEGGNRVNPPAGEFNSAVAPPDGVKLADYLPEARTQYSESKLKWMARFIPKYRLIVSGAPASRATGANLFATQMIDHAHPNVSVAAETEIHQWNALGNTTNLKISKSMHAHVDNNYGTPEGFARDFLDTVHGAGESLNPHVNASAQHWRKNSAELTEEGIRNDLFAYTQPAFQTFIPIEMIMGKDLEMNRSGFLEAFRAGRLDDARALAMQIVGAEQKLLGRAEATAEHTVTDKKLVKDILIRLNDYVDPKELDAATEAIEKALREAKVIEEKFNAVGKRPIIVDLQAHFPTVKLPIIYDSLKGATPGMVYRHISTQRPGATLAQAENILAQAIHFTGKGYRFGFPVSLHARGYFPLQYDVEKILSDEAGARGSFVDSLIGNGGAANIAAANKIFDNFVAELKARRLANDPTFYCQLKASATKNRMMYVNPNDIIDYLDHDVEGVIQHYFNDMGADVAINRVVRQMGFRNWAHYLEWADTSFAKHTKVLQRQAGEELVSRGRKKIQRQLEEVGEEQRLVHDVPYILRGRRRPGELPSSRLAQTVMGVTQCMNVLTKLGCVPLTAIEDLALAAKHVPLFRNIGEITRLSFGGDMKNLSREEIEAVLVYHDTAGRSARFLQETKGVKDYLGKVANLFYRSTGLPYIERHNIEALYSVIVHRVANDIAKGTNLAKYRFSRADLANIRKEIASHTVLDTEEFDLRSIHWNRDAQRVFHGECERLLLQAHPMPGAAEVPSILEGKIGMLFAMFQRYQGSLTMNILVPLLENKQYGELVSLLVKGYAAALVTTVARGYLRNDPYDFDDPRLYEAAFLRSPIGMAEHLLNPIMGLVMNGVQGDKILKTGDELAGNLVGSGQLSWAKGAYDAVAKTIGRKENRPVTEREIQMWRAIVPFQNHIAIQPILNHGVLPWAVRNFHLKPAKTRHDRNVERKVKARTKLAGDGKTV